jgi:transposase InsO family protein
MSDNGGEYTSQELAKFFKSQGIRHQQSPPYLHKLSGVGEWFNRTIVIMARAMGEEASLPPSLWTEAINTATYVKNRLPHSRLPLSQTLYEVFHTTKPKITYLKPYGQICYS